jgi:hypothetical protein
VTALIQGEIPPDGRNLCRSAFGSRKHFTDCSGEIFYTGTWNDDGVAAAVSLFSYAQKFSAIVFPKLDMEMFALNLKFFGFDDVIH